MSMARAFTPALPVAQFALRGASHMNEQVNRLERMRATPEQRLVNLEKELDKTPEAAPPMEKIT
jgi:hypothetical protein